MSKRVLLFGAVGLLVLAVGAYYYVKSRPVQGIGIDALRRIRLARIDFGAFRPGG